MKKALLSLLFLFFLSTGLPAQDLPGPDGFSDRGVAAEREEIPLEEGVMQSETYEVESSSLDPALQEGVPYIVRKEGEFDFSLLKAPNTGICLTDDIDRRRTAKARTWRAITHNGKYRTFSVDKDDRVLSGPMVVLRNDKPKWVNGWVRPGDMVVGEWDRFAMQLSLKLIISESGQKLLWVERLEAYKIWWAVRCGNKYHTVYLQVERILIPLPREITVLRYTKWQEDKKAKAVCRKVYCKHPVAVTLPPVIAYYPGAGQSGPVEVITLQQGALTFWPGNGTDIDVTAVASSSSSSAASASASASAASGSAGGSTSTHPNYNGNYNSHDGSDINRRRRDPGYRQR